MAVHKSLAIPSNTLSLGTCFSKCFVRRPAKATRTQCLNSVGRPHGCLSKRLVKLPIKKFPNWMVRLGCFNSTQHLRFRESHHPGRANNCVKDIKDSCV